MKGFVDFIRKGNLVQLAVAFVMGVAFTAVITSFVNNVISPLLGLIGGTDFTDQGWCIDSPCKTTFDATTKTVTSNGVFIAWGAFLTALITFVLIAAIVYFFVVKPYEALEQRLSKQGDDELSPTDIELLTEIRDALVADNKSGSDT